VILFFFGLVTFSSLPSSGAELLTVDLFTASEVLSVAEALTCGALGAGDCTTSSNSAVLIASADFGVYLGE